MQEDALEGDRAAAGSAGRGEDAEKARVTVPRLVHLADMKELRVASGDPDVRGWNVRTADGRRIGTVKDLIVDVDSMKVRYIEVRIDSAVLSSATDRFALVPIASARLDEEADDVHLNAAIVDPRSLPESDQQALARQAASSAHDELPVVHAEEANFFGSRRRGIQGAHSVSPPDQSRRPANELP